MRSLDWWATQVDQLLLDKKIKTKQCDCDNRRAGHIDYTVQAKVTEHTALHSISIKTNLFFFIHFSAFAHILHSFCKLWAKIIAILDCNNINVVAVSIVMDKKTNNNKQMCRLRQPHQRQMMMKTKPRKREREKNARSRTKHQAPRIKYEIAAIKSRKRDTNTWNKRRKNEAHSSKKKPRKVAKQDRRYESEKVGCRWWWCVSPREHNERSTSVCVCVWCVCGVLLISNCNSDNLNLLSKSAGRQTNTPHNI